MQPKLSILIPSIPERFDKLCILKSKLKKQIEAYENDVEIITHVTPSRLNGGADIGTKRNECIYMAKGEYIAFVDDDDDIAPNYIESVLKGIELGVDVITFRAVVEQDNYIGQVRMGLKYKENEEMRPDGIVTRPPWHMCPHKRIHAGQFPVSNYGEDWQYMEQVLPKLKTEHYIDRILFTYRHSAASSMADNEPKEDVQSE